MDYKFSLTGDEDQHSYHATYDHFFRKTITINCTEEYDVYEESFIFGDYTFTVGKKVNKIVVPENWKDFMKDYKESIENNDWVILWIHDKDNLNIKDIEDDKRKYSYKLFEEYYKYYKKMVDVPKHSTYIFLNKS